MKLVTFPIPKEKLNKKNVVIAAAVVILAVIVGLYSWLQSQDRVSDFNLSGYIQRLAAGFSTLGDRETTDHSGSELAQVVTPEDLQITLPASGRTYEQTAQSGEGVTHLARRALGEYLAKSGQGADLTVEHKIYIEDYIQKKTGDEWLDLGQTVSFSEDLIREAVEASWQLTDEQLENLRQYSAQVSSF
ncbi:MAG: Uncharacterized protein G01um101430_288 [Parcubacteria group bacterium Gr01-1014_30]|nr:MAG: Uncharacterized protein G01um101430_288 [Parcubacteria group bacterium Gr01-1014_30]